MRKSVCGLLLTLAMLAATPAQGQIAIVGERVTCENGVASGYPCSNVDLLSYLPIRDIGGTAGTRLNDIWGWTDPATGKEYALVGRTDGTAFVDVSNPLRPVYLGNLPTHGGRVSAWRDIKVYADHAYVVADNAGAHGLQVFDLRQLRSVESPPKQFVETAHYAGFGSAHNVAVNTDTGFLYVVGISGFQTGTCGPGLHIVDVRQPAAPTYAGCFADLTTGLSGNGYTHDTQCVVYRGPDAGYQGREICVSSNETALSIADVTEKNRPVSISTVSYQKATYVHQGWFSEDQRYFFVDDELDEPQHFFNTRTIICDLGDLDQPVCATEYFGKSQAQDHNQYVVGHRLFQANYKSGLRILDIHDPLKPFEIGFFDTYILNDTRGYEGTWSNYPFFKSNIVILSSIGEGLFVVQPTKVASSATHEEVPEGFELAPPYPNPFNPQTVVTLAVDAAQHVSIDVYDVLGRRVAVLHAGLLAPGTHRFTLDAAGMPGGTYVVRARGAGIQATRTVTLLK